MELRSVQWTHAALYYKGRSRLDAGMTQPPRGQSLIYQASGTQRRICPIWAAFNKWTKGVDNRCRTDYEARKPRPTQRENNQVGGILN